MNYLGIISTSDDDPFLRPAPRRPMEVEPTEEQKEQQGFGWFGKSLGDGVYMK